jgi:hypothetical protein
MCNIGGAWKPVLCHLTDLNVALKDHGEMWWILFHLLPRKSLCNLYYLWRVLKLRLRDFVSYSLDIKIIYILFTPTKVHNPNSIFCPEFKHVVSLFLPGKVCKWQVVEVWRITMFTLYINEYILLLPGAELPSWKFWPSQRPLSIFPDPGRRLTSFGSSIGKCPVWCYPPICTWVFLVISLVRGFQLNIFLTVLVSGILCTWPNQLSLWALM